MEETRWVKAAGYVLMPLICYYAVNLMVLLVWESLHDLLRINAGWNGQQTLLTGLGALCSIVPLIYIWKKDSSELFKESEKRQQIDAVIWEIISFTGGIAGSYILGRLMEVSGFSGMFSNQTQEEFLASPLILQIVVLVLLAPVAEELLYRGILYKRILRFCPKWAAVLITSGLFAIGHGNVIQAVYAFPMALILHALYEKGGGLSMPVLFHMGANFCTVIWCFAGLAG